MRCPAGAERPPGSAVLAEQPLGLVCFRNERVDLTVDGQRLERPVTPWS
jgi:hypothetical protein